MRVTVCGVTMAKLLTMVIFANSNLTATNATKVYVDSGRPNEIKNSIN